MRLARTTVSRSSHLVQLGLIDPLSCFLPPRFEQRHLLGSSFDFIESAWNKVKSVRTQTHRFLGNQNTGNALGKSLYPASEIDRIPDRSVFTPLFRPDQADHGRSRVYADTDVEIRIGVQIFSERIQHVRHFE